MKEVGRNEENPGNTAWENPVQSTSSQQRNTGQSSSSSSWKLRVHEDAETSAHSTRRPRLRLTQLLNFEEIHRVSFKHSVRRSRLEGSNHPEHVLNIWQMKKIYIYTVFRRISGFSSSYQAGISFFCFFLWLFAEFWSEFCNRCFWVFRLMGGFLSTSAKPILQFLSGCLHFSRAPCAFCSSLSSVGFCQFCFSTDHHGDLQRISCRMGVCCFLWYE